MDRVFRLVLGYICRRVPDELVGIPSTEDEGLRSGGVSASDWSELFLTIIGTGGGIAENEEETIS